MLSSHIVASFVLAGLSMAYPKQNLTAPAPTQAATTTSTFTSFAGPTTAGASLDDQISSTAQLSKRKHHHGDDEEWDKVANNGIKVGEKLVEGLLDWFPDDAETETISHTITVTHTPEPTEGPGEPTITPEPEKPTQTEVTVTTTVVVDPPTGSVIAPPAETIWPLPPDNGGGCYIPGNC